MRILLLVVSGSSPSWLREAREDFEQRLRHFCEFDLKELKSSGFDRDDRAVKVRQDTDLILKNLKDDDLVVLLDERGRAFTSEKFADQIEKFSLMGKRRIVFIIGGSFGVDDRLRQRSQLQVSLAPFVVNHWVAQLVVIEQIYRAFTILRKLPYHNA